MFDFYSDRSRLGPPLLWLPPELILMITKLLSVGNSICFGTTCHHMYAKVDMKPWDLIGSIKVEDTLLGRRYCDAISDPDLSRGRWNNGRLVSESWDVLMNLERQLSGLELCHFCQIFHPRIPVASGSLLHPISIHCRGFESDANIFFMGRWSNWGFGFTNIYAVMSRQRLGPSFGLPLSHLHSSADWTFAGFYKR